VPSRESQPETLVESPPEIGGDSSRLKPDGPRSDAKLLPGMAIISLWMLFEACIGAYAVYKGVFTGENRYGVLGVATILAGCGLGLLQRRRWGWALSLGMAFCSLCFGCFALLRLHAPQALVMTFLNGVFFLYLVRAEVRARLR
jgi:hypothetical protein